MIQLLLFKHINHTLLHSLLIIIMLFNGSNASAQDSISNNAILHNNEILFKRVPEQQCVILIHGITASPQSLQSLAQSLQADDYNVVNIGWQTGGALDVIAEATIVQALQECRAIDDVRRIHLLGHSTGGLIIRYYLSQHPIKELGYVLMLGVPNHGSFLINLAQATKSDYQETYGATGEYLRTGADSFTAALPDATGYYAGVIAGIGHISRKDKIYGLFLRGLDDGRVSLTSTMIEGMNDFIITPYQHNQMIEQPSIFQQVKYFIRNGVFEIN